MLINRALTILFTLVSLFALAVLLTACAPDREVVEVVAGPQGPQGPQGPAGADGQNASPCTVAPYFENEQQVGALITCPNSSEIIYNGTNGQDAEAVLCEVQKNGKKRKIVCGETSVEFDCEDDNGSED